MAGEDFQINKYVFSKAAADEEKTKVQKHSLIFVVAGSYSTGGQLKIKIPLVSLTDNRQSEARVAATRI